MFAGRLLSLALFGAAAVSGLQAAPAQTIPSMTAEDLNGKTIRVPGDLTGDPALLLVAFEREQQEEIDRVLPLIEQAHPAAPGLRVWEIPVINNPGSIGRFAIDTGMKAGISSAKVRGTVVTLYVDDRKAWASLIGLGKEQEVYLVALGKGGKVLGNIPAKQIASASQVIEFIKSLRSKTLSENGPSRRAGSNP